MAMIVEDVGCAQILAVYLNNVWPVGGNNLTLKLYATNVTPSTTGADTAATFTVAAGGGYADKTLTRGSWTVNTGNNPRDATYAEQTFTFTGALTTNTTIYGYYIVDADNVILNAELLGTPFTPANNGDNIVITPKIALSHGTPAA